jgi:hypothetical protein
LRGEKVEELRRKEEEGRENKWNSELHFVGEVVKLMERKLKVSEFKRV